MNTHSMALFLAALMSLGFANTAGADSKKDARSATVKAEADAKAAEQNDHFEFKTDESAAPVQSNKNPLIFKMQEKDSTGPAPVVEQADSSVEGSTYKVYPGYPKHQIAISLVPTKISSKWNYSGQDFNYNSNSSSSMDLAYDYLSSPLTRFSLYYSRYESSVKAGSASGYTITDSKVALDNYGVKSNFCTNSSVNFLQQYCFGVDLGVESYPLLDFTDSVTLALGKVQDVVLGVNVGYNHPLSAGMLLRFKLGYNMGTGSGSSGELTTKINNSVSAGADIEWNLKGPHGITVGTEYKKRSAKVEGKRGTNNDTWKSEITTTSFKFGYLYTFQ